MLSHHWPPYTHHSEFSGYERIAYYLNELHDVDVLTWKFGRLDYSDGPNVHRILTPPSDVFLERRLLLSVSALLRAKNYDVVHALYPIPGLFPSLRYPTVATIHLTNDLKKDSIWLRYQTLLQRLLFKKARCLIAVSSNLKKILEEKYHVKNVVYIPHGIDAEHFCPQPQKREIRERLLGGRFDFIFLTTGMMGTKLSVILEMAGRFPKVKFIGVGIGKQPVQLPNVTLLSGISEKELKDIYDIADIFFKPLTFATANNSLLEAMSMSKPIITDAIPGVLDYLDENCAYLVRPGQDYAEIVKHALENEEERKEKGRKAREKAKREFDWTVVARKVSDVYEALVA